jgi:hypothetical protein
VHWKYKNFYLTPWSRILQKLTVIQLVKKFPAFMEASEPGNSVSIVSDYGLDDWLIKV